MRVFKHAAPVADEAVISESERWNANIHYQWLILDSVPAEAGFACTGFSIRGLPAIGLQIARNDPPLAFLVLDADQLAELLGRARELLSASV